MQQPRQRAVALPLLKATVAGWIGRIAVGQIVPRSAGAQDPENSVPHRTRIAPRPPALPARFRLEQGLEKRPRGIGEIQAQVLPLSPPIDNTKFDLL